MQTAVVNALAMARFGGFRMGHAGGGGFGLLLAGLVILGVVAWAVSRPQRSESAKS
jgi:outer membrane lipoprotein SlyB